MTHLDALLSYLSVSSPHVRLHVLLTGVQTDVLALVADAVEIAATALYLLGVRRLRKRGHRWPSSAAFSFAAAMFVLWVAIGSGLAAYDTVNVQVHVVQHVLLMMVVAPLVALSKPVTLASQAARRRTQVRLLKVVHSRVMAVLTFPVLTWFLYYGTMYAFFTDRTIYDYAVNNSLFHDGSHVVFLIIGLLYWQPLLGADPTRWRLPYAARVLVVFLGMPFEAFLGIYLDMTSRSIDPINTLAATHTAGQTFWVLAMAATAISIGVIAIQWYRQLQRQTPREDRMAEAEAAQSLAKAAALGVTPDREGWTVPAWRLAQIERERSMARNRASGLGSPPPGGS